MKRTRRALVLWGGTGHARVLNEAVQDLGFEITGIFDNRPIESPLPGVPVYLGEEGFSEWLSQRSPGSDECWFSIAIGGQQGQARIRYFELLRASGLKPAPIVHASAWVARDALIEDGAQVLACARAGTHSIIAAGAILNTGASVDHDCIVGEGAHIGPGAILTGEVTVERGAFVGAGATILPRLRIGAFAVVGAGAVVTRDVAEGTTVVGSPAKAR